MYNSIKGANVTQKQIWGFFSVFLLFFQTRAARMVTLTVLTFNIYDPVRSHVYYLSSPAVPFLTEQSWTSLWHRSRWCHLSTLPSSHPLAHPDLCFGFPSSLRPLIFLSSPHSKPDFPLTLSHPPGLLPQPPRPFLTQCVPSLSVLPVTHTQLCCFILTSHRSYFVLRGFSWLPRLIFAPVPLTRSFNYTRPSAGLLRVDSVSLWDGANTVYVYIIR